MIALGALFAGIAVLIGFDLINDYDEGAGAIHLGIESLVLVAALAGLALLLWRLRRTAVALNESHAVARRWRCENQSLLQGLGAAIETQFTAWQLTRAEAEVGLLVLKGLSHKDIAAIRQTSERTIREQARAVYRKSGLAGRSALSAYFLEDLLLPAQHTTATPGSVPPRSESRPQ